MEYFFKFEWLAFYEYLNFTNQNVFKNNQNGMGWGGVFLLSILCIIPLDRNPDWDTIEAWNEFFALVYHFSPRPFTFKNPFAQCIVFAYYKSFQTSTMVPVCRWGTHKIKYIKNYFYTKLHLSIDLPTLSLVAQWSKPSF